MACFQTVDWHSVCLPTCSAVPSHTSFFRDAKVRDELLQRFTSAVLVLHRICGGKERLIGKDLSMLVTIQRLVATIHGVCVDCTANVQSYKHPVCTISPCQWEYGGTHQPLCGDLECLCRLTQSDVPPFTKIRRSDGRVPLLQLKWLCQWHILES